MLNKKSTLFLASILVAASVTTTALSQKVNAASNKQKEYSVLRISGADRFETSYKIADKYKETSEENKIGGVILTLGENFPDALSGSVLSRINRMPILLAGKTPELSKAALDYIDKNLSVDKKIYILGGAGGIKDSVINKLHSMGYKNVLRLGGVDRYHTNTKIIEELNPVIKMPVIIANGENFPDALSASAVASSQTNPILLVKRDSIPDTIKSILSRIKPYRIFVVGGTGSVSNSNLNSLKKLTGLSDDDIVRIGGKDRYETSIKIARYFNLNSDTVTFANGENFPDALSGSALSSLKDAPLLLINNENVSKQKSYIDSTKYTKEIFYGGTGVISDSTIDKLSKN